LGVVVLDTKNQVEALSMLLDPDCNCTFCLVPSQQASDFSKQLDHYDLLKKVKLILVGNEKNWKVYIAGFCYSANIKTYLPIKSRICTDESWWPFGKYDFKI